VRHSPINEGYIIKEDEYEQVMETLDKLHLRLLVIDSVSSDEIEKIVKILTVPDYKKAID
jgi:PHD/YefM family antitoxin component YafN of YafNO toxin-antitoxin module